MPTPPCVPPPGTPIDFKALRREEIALARIHPTEEPDREPSPELVESLRETGNIQPLLLGLHPEIEHEFELIDGHHRFFGLPLAGRNSALCAIIDRVVPEAERIALTTLLSGLHRTVGPVELAVKAQRWLELNPGATQKDCAKAFKRSESTISRFIAEHCMDADFKAKTQPLNSSKRQSLMTESDPERRQRAIEFALTPEGGKLPSRDKIILFLKRERARGEKKRGRKPKAVKFSFAGRTWLVTRQERDTTSALIEDTKALLQRMAKHSDVDLDGLSFVVK